MSDEKNPEGVHHIDPRAAWADRHLPGWKREAATTWGTAKCSLHDDSRASLRFNLFTGGGMCHGCHWQGTITEYAQAVGLPTDGLPDFSRSNEPRTEKRGRKKKDLGREVAWYTYRDSTGNPIFQQVRYEPKDFRLKHLNEDGVWKWGRAGKPLIPYRLPELIKAPKGEAIWWVEGEKDADNGAALGLTVTTTPQGVKSFIHVPAESLEVFRGKVVIFIRDNDPQGKDLSLLVGSALQGIAAGFFMLDLPDLPPKGDLSDWIAARKAQKLSDEDLKRTLYAYLEDPSVATEWTTSMSPRPVLELGDRELHELSDEALKALIQWNEPPQLFCDRAGQIVRVERIAEETLVSLVTSDGLRGYLSEAARWVKIKKVRGDWEQVSVFPETAVATDISQRHSAKLPVLEEFSRAPVFDRDLRLIRKPGYDRHARLFADIADLNLPRTLSQVPSPSELEEAKRWLLDEMLGDFPFVDAASRAHTLGATLAPFVRQSLGGPIPLHLIESPTQGTGKSLLAKVVAIPATGAPPSSMSDPGQDETEWRKRITSTLIKLPSYIFIDNIGSQLDSDTLASALTSDWWEDRLLGSSKNIKLPQRATWLATGNNLHLKMDIARRCCPIRIDAKTDQPWKRDGFRHENIIDWSKENRPWLIWACLTMVCHWIAQGCPPGQQKMGSFEGYARVIGGILTTAGIPGFLGNYEESFRRSDTASEEWEAFVTSWYQYYSDKPRTVTELSDYMEKNNLLEMVIPAGKNPAGRRVSLGKKLQGQIDRIYDGVTVFLHTTRNSAGCREYHVRKIRNDVPDPQLPAEPEAATPEMLAEVGLF